MTDEHKHRKRTVIITGMFGPYTGELDKELADDEVEIWGCNMTYTHQKGLTRLHVFDPLEHWLLNPEKYQAFIDDVNELDIPIHMQEAHALIPKSVRYPVEDIVRHFGVCYFTSTLTFQMAQAIYEGFDQVVIHRIHCMPHSVEYFHQKSCLDFWCGIALGHGIKLFISDDSHLCKPHPWQTPFYGYVRKIDGDIMSVALAHIVAQVRKVVPKFEDNTDMGEKIRVAAERPSKTVQVYPHTDTKPDEVIIPTRLTSAEVKARNAKVKQDQFTEAQKRERERQAKERANVSHH